MEEFFTVQRRDTDDWGGAVYDQWHSIGYFKNETNAQRFKEKQPEFIEDEDEDDGDISGPYEYRIINFKFDD